MNHRLTAAFAEARVAELRRTAERGGAGHAVAAGSRPRRTHGRRTRVLPRISPPTNPLAPHHQEGTPS
jgi:hypothetical protein